MEFKYIPNRVFAIWDHVDHVPTAPKYIASRFIITVYILYPTVTSGRQIFDCVSDSLVLAFRKLPRSTGTLFRIAINSSPLYGHIK